MTKAWIPHPTVLRGKTVELIPLERGHLEELCQAAADPTLWKHIPAEGFKPDRFAELYNLTIVNREQGLQYPFVIHHPLSGRLIGSTRLFDLHSEDKKLEIGWTWIIREYWGTGVNTECKFMLLNFCFEHLGVRRVQLKTDERNAQSRKAILGIGAKFEGILRKDRIKDDGTSRNAAYYSILDVEWPGIKQRLINKLDI
jgi:RimJ/RimL family protein N-acetyltransferase